MKNKAQRERMTDKEMLAVSMKIIKLVRKYTTVRGPACRILDAASAAFGGGITVMRTIDRKTD